jgi:ectoine hydroxylase
MSGSIFDAEQRSAWDRDGYVMVRKLFDDEEIAILRGAIEGDPALRASLYDRRDASGKATRMALWNHPGDSVYGLAARSRRVVDTMEDLLGGEVYHYHSKLTAKEPLEGGAWEWHQDYGYWYHNGMRYPLHGQRHGRAGPGHARERLPAGGEGLAPLRAASSTACCLASRWAPTRAASRRSSGGCRWSTPRWSRATACSSMQRAAPLRPEPLPQRRWTVLHCYNAARNNPTSSTTIRSYTPLQKVDDGAIKRAGVRFAQSRAEFRERSANPPELAKRIG